MLKLFLTLFLINKISADIVSYIDYGGKVPTDDRFDVWFKYDASANRDCEVALKNPSQNWATYAYKKVPCSAGTGVVKGVTLNYSPNPAAGAGYVIEVKVLNGATQTAYMKADVTVTNGKQGFHTYQGKLYDANKSVFLIRGVNNAHADYDGSGGGTGGKRWWAYDALPSIQSVTKSNTVRILWRLKSDLTTTDLDKIVTEVIRLRMVPMVELHDATGNSDANYLNEMAKYWANNVWLLIKHRKHIIVNIANEWSEWWVSETAWRDAYKTAVKTIRDAGFSGTLVIDAPAYAQNPKGPILYGNELINADSARNLMFSVHMYSDWTSVKPLYNIANDLLKIKNANIPFLVGEFAHKHPAHDVNGQPCVNAVIDARLIMAKCQEYGFGYLGWSWAGNGKDDKCGPIGYLDICNNVSWRCTSGISEWGNILLNDSNGLINTSRPSTAF